MKNANHQLMVEPIKDTEKEIEAFITEFSDLFYGKFGMYPSVTYASKANLIKVTLKDIEDIANYLLSLDLDVTIPKATIKTRTRHRILVIYRQCVFKMARDLGYGFSRIGIHFGYDHATVLYANKNIKNLIATRDKQVIRVLTKLEDELKKRIGSDGIFSSDSETKIDA